MRKIKKQYGIARTRDEAISCTNLNRLLHPQKWIRNDVLKMIMVVFLLMLTITLSAQSKNVTINIKDGSIEDLLKEIQKQTGMNYFFNHEEIPEGTKVTVNVKNESIEEALNQAFKNTDLTYSIINDVILIIPKSNQNKSEKPKGLTQTIRGKIIDKDSKITLPGANIIVLNSAPLIGSVSDFDGNFRLENVPLGRHTIKVSYVGYEELLLPEIMVGSAKEVILTLQLSESLTELEEVIVRPYVKGTPQNEMATVSGRSFSVEEAGRFAGGVHDPGRMALSFAGVNTDNDASNQIVIRGNSPNAMLWRIEGVQIPIPNHFSMEGWDAGYVSILSSNMMGKTDFYCGAFPAEYGNATSGVFDISLRNGNNEKRENSFEFGALGADISMEGPFSKNYKGSYLFNYRYATFSILNLIGIRISGDLLPEYSDLSFKFYLPTKKIGSFSIWGLGGKGYIEDAPIADSTIWLNEYMRNGYHTTTYMGATGITHTLFVSKQSYFKTVLSYSGNSSLDESYRLDSNYIRDYFYKELLFSSAGRISTMYNHKFNAYFSLRTGVILSKLFYDYTSDYEFEDFWINDLKGNGNTHTYQGYIQTKLNIGPRLTLNTGMHYFKFGLTGEESYEPRAGLILKLPNSQSVNFGFGMHSKHDYLMTYFVKEPDTDGNWNYVNKDLQLQKSTHYVLGYSKMFRDDLKMLIEMYYQDLSKLPVSPDTSATWSTINDYYVGFDAVNKGIGRNYGIEFTLEKYFTNNFYYLATASIFDAKYKPLNGKWYNTRYNANYIFNFTGGKEWIIKDENMLGANFRLLWTGGRRDTPRDIEKLKALEEGEFGLFYSEDKRWSIKHRDYFRLDIGANYRINKGNKAHVFSLDIQNVLNIQNVAGAYWDDYQKKMVETTLQGILPVVNYKLEF